jgi:alkaline phosphatase D
MKRRDFLRNSGWFVVGATLVGVPGGCADDDPRPVDEAPPEGTHAFPQGVASGDPSASSVVLWTRVALATSPNGGFGAITLRLQVSATADFATLIVDQSLVAAAQSDHTLRVLVTNLSPATYYYYRFVAGKDVSAGRTRTAPARDADVQVNLAWVSCQDYSAGHYGTYRQMIVDDAARPEADKIHAVVHLGDMIYETRADGFQAAIDDEFRPIMLTNRDGQPRAVGAFPSGGGVRAGTSFARSVDDYRHLYRTFLSDPDLQEARALWPFVCVWDDHEFTDDNWQSQANYDGASSLNEADQTRKVAASQAWFEYIPAHLSGAASVPGVSNPARDFVPTTVRDAAFSPANADNFVDEANNAAAVGAITIYRSLRFGQRVELVMTDQRSYRSDHAIAEEDTSSQLFFPGAPRNAVPLQLVNVFDAGRTAAPTPPETVLGVINRRTTSPPGTMLGAAQKEWWKATMKGSDATWKIWGTEVMLLRLRLPPPPGDVARVVSADAWDGYPSERNELMKYLQTENIKNLVALAGDIHASFAGIVMDDYDTATPQPVAFELTAAGVASNSLFSFFEAATRPPAPAALRSLVTVDASAAQGSKFTENLNMLLLNGVASAGTFAASSNLDAALAAADANTNPHLKYCDTNAQGYGYIKAGATQMDATIVTINRPTTVPGATGPGVRRRVSFTIPKDNPAGAVGPTVEGTKPFPLK